MENDQPALINARVLRASSRCHRHRSTGLIAAGLLRHGVAGPAELRSTRDQFLTGQHVDACSTRVRPLTNDLYVIQIILQFHCRWNETRQLIAITLIEFVAGLEIYVEATTYRVQVHTVATKCIDTPLYL